MVQRYRFLAWAISSDIARMTGLRDPLVDINEDEDYGEGVRGDFSLRFDEEKVRKRVRWRERYLSWGLEKEDLESLARGDGVVERDRSDVAFHEVIHAFWANNREDLCTFFVALSRAKSRVIITYCQKRDEKIQSMELNKYIYDIFKEAGVKCVYH